MVKVRRIGQRELGRGAFLSADPEWRNVQVRFLAIALFFTGTFTWLAHRKLVRSFGALPVLLVEGVLAAAAVGFGVRQVLEARKPKVEPQDTELELLPLQVQEQLEQGSLRPLDLVHERGTWTTLHESIQFSEAAEPSHRRAQTKARALMAVMVLGGLVVVAVGGMVLLNLGDLLMWLSRD